MLGCRLFLLLPLTETLVFQSVGSGTLDCVCIGSRRQTAASAVPKASLWGQRQNGQGKVLWG